MDFRRLDDETIEILPEGRKPEAVLEVLARLSYETAESPAPFFVQPFEVPPESVDFRSQITREGLRLDYLNGRLLSTHVQWEGGRLLFDAERFEADRGSPDAFLALARERLKEGQGRRA
jgi:hypothetical protein